MTTEWHKRGDGTSFVVSVSSGGLDPEGWYWAEAHTSKPRGYGPFPTEETAVANANAHPPYKSKPKVVKRPRRSKKEMASGYVDMKELLQTMFKGWCLHENSYNHAREMYMRSEEECMVEACGGDVLQGELLVLFGHYSNDVTSLAAHYGIGLARKQPDGSLLYADGTLDTLLKGGELTVTEIPTAPSPEHYWYGGVWRTHQEDKGETACGQG